MARSTLIYKENGKSYRPDTCKPLKGAAAAGKVQLAALGRGKYPGHKLPAHELKGLNLVGFWDATTEQDWGLEWHRNEGLELTFLESGSAPFCLGDDVIEMQPNDLVITRPWQPHRIGNPTVSAGRVHWLVLDVGVRQPHQTWKWPDWIILSKADKDELTRFLRQNEHPNWPGGINIRKCFQQFGEIVQADNAESQTSRLAVFVNELLMLLLDMFRNQTVPLRKSLTSSRRSVKLFLREIKSHLDMPWTVQTMAESCELGVTRFVQLCKTITNMTPMQYLNTIRVEQACELLREQPDRNVIQIALDCGFSSSQYFATVFRRITKQSPRQYRSQILPDSSAETK